MVRNRWIGIVVAIVLLAAIAAPLRAALPSADHRDAVVETRAGGASSPAWLGSWIEAAWSWFVAVVSEETGSIVPSPDPNP